MISRSDQTVNTMRKHDGLCHAYLGLECIVNLVSEGVASVTGVHEALRGDVQVGVGKDHAPYSINALCQKAVWLLQLQYANRLHLNCL